MAKRTVENKYQTHDAALSIRRQLLSAEKDADEVYYRTGQLERHEESKDDAPIASSRLTSTIAQEDITSPAPGRVAVPSHDAQALHPDARVQAKEIIQVMVAEKLKRPLHDISLGSTIKRMAGGWSISILANECLRDAKAF